MSKRQMAGLKGPSIIGVSIDGARGAIRAAEVLGCLPQLLLSLVVSVQNGARTVPHCVVPPVHWNMHVPWLQIVMAEGSVGQAFPQEPLRITKSHSDPQHAFDLPAPGACQLSLQQTCPLVASGGG